ncbi:MAG: hypothetical protein KUG64_11110 [Cycloclasticus sp.]|nr:hypothetical protein [Cycloclasticus sp.]
MSPQENEKVHLTEKDIRGIIRHTVKDTLTQIGIDKENPLEMQKDFQHLREGRVASEMYKDKAKGTLVGVFVTGLLTAVVLGAKEFFSN